MKLDKDETILIVGSIVPVLLWWLLKGHRKYNTKGMR